MLTVVNIYFANQQLLENGLVLTNNGEAINTEMLTLTLVTVSHINQILLSSENNRMILT